MDPVAHTLVGACLGEAGLSRQSRLATAALVIGANAPDIDAVTMVLDRNLMFGFRRGWTHGVVAWVVLPALITVAMVAYDRLRPARDAEGVPVRPWRILGITTVAVLTHPLLDWLNTYGIRPLMPFDGTWFYGDSLFIVDPWVWLLSAAAVVLARSDTRLTAGGWVVLALAATGVMTGWPREMSPVGQVTWGVGVAAIVAARTRPALMARAQRVARVSFALLVLYLASALTITALARDRARAWLSEQGVAVDDVFADPVPGDPFAREMVLVGEGHYYLARVAFWADPVVSLAGPPLPVGDGALARAALADPSIDGYANWLRYPRFEVEPTADGARVTILDMRFARWPWELGTFVIDVPARHAAF